MSWSAAWVVWIAVTATSFGVLEWVTFRKHQTLSENIRRWLGIEPRKRWRRFGIVAFAGAITVFFAWFLPHIIIG